ncbi:DUF6089 family protein [Pinibacter aurantiacus]|uniref:OmpA family protein n=1 Tax=Pinibacter aurantiacus TaxID=2851599 RepID=A0A9E2W6K8_9BACT|nr:DUF6089 family protein [Pinibacter aurantiacus]MBV4359943.1 OmpA family protein [Pinibacter aurantiacus]
MEKFNKKISILLSSALLLALTANCQETKDISFSSSKVVTDSVSYNSETPKYEFGIGGGIVVYQGDLAPTVWGAYRSFKPGLQANITRLFYPSLAVRLGATVGQFAASDVKSAFKQSYREYRKYDFTTSFAELSLMAQWTPFGKANWRLNPYLLGGAGISYLHVKNDWSKIDFDNFAGENLQQRLLEDSAEKHTFFAPVLPLGVGLKYDVSEKVSLKAEWINRITFSDYLDGFSKAANPDKKDRYSSVMLSLNYAFGRNKHSKVIRTTTTKTSESVAVTNKVNSKPKDKIEKSVTPVDTQEDPKGEPDPTSVTTVKNDNTRYLKDIQHNLDLLLEMVKKDGCAYCNSEGIALLKDIQEKLNLIIPKVQGTEDLALVDDIQHKLALLLQQVKGEDYITPLKEIQNRTNLLTDKVNKRAKDLSDAEIQSLLDFPGYIIYFSFDLYDLQGDSYNKLDQIAARMKADPSLRVRFSGFTDLKGTVEYNNKLSLDRATICKTYLITRNISASRIKVEAFGKSRWVVGAYDPDQQWRNRRVEVFLY